MRKARGEGRKAGKEGKRVKKRRERVYKECNSDNMVDKYVRKGK